MWNWIAGACHKAARGLLCQAMLLVAEHSPSWFDDVWMTDATPVPCGASRETAKRSNLAGESRLRLLRQPFPVLLGLRSEEHTSELQSRGHLVCRLLLEKKEDDRVDS